MSAGWFHMEALMCISPEAFEDEILLKDIKALSLSASTIMTFPFLVLKVYPGIYSPTFLHSRHPTDTWMQLKTFKEILLFFSYPSSYTLLPLCCLFFAPYGLCPSAWLPVIHTAQQQMHISGLSCLFPAVDYNYTALTSWIIFFLLSHFSLSFDFSFYKSDEWFRFIFTHLGHLSV